MRRLAKLIALLAAVAAAPAVAGATPVAGTWQKVPPAPSAVFGAGAWSGHQLLVVGRRPFTSVAVAEAYDPAAKSWSTLAQPPKVGDDSMCCKVLWTGKRLLAWGAFSGAAFDPTTGSWQPVSGSLPGGIVVWTGREAIGWGGGCCGDARADGAGYNPDSGSFRKLARSPLAPDQRPVGAWTGRELVLFVSGLTPDGKPSPARFARAAAYNPRTNSWRRIAPMPTRGGSAVWDGREVLVVGGGAKADSALAYNPRTNHWRRLASLPSHSYGGTSVWTGRRLLLWSGQTGRSGLAYDPRTNRWSTLPAAPFRARGAPIVTWTGRSLIVWGGEIGTPVGKKTPPKFPLDGGMFTPRAR